MKTKGKVKQRLKQILFRHLQKKIRAGYKQYPENCKNNRKDLGSLSLGLCGYCTDKTMVCDSRVDASVQFASKCSNFKPIFDKVQIKAEFKKLASDEKLRGQLALECPDVIALMWVLDDDTQEVVGWLDSDGRSDTNE